jgi:hypothetical protein
MVKAPEVVNEDDYVTRCLESEFLNVREERTALSSCLLEMSIKKSLFLAKIFLT